MKRMTNPNDKGEKSKRTGDGNEIRIRKQTLDKLLRHKRSDDMIALYVFLNYTALWQRTNQPRATVGFIAKGLCWGVNKVRRIKSLLAQRGMIEDLCSVDPESKQITGWYVRVCYFHPDYFREGGKATLTILPRVAKRDPNALRANSRNALRATTRNGKPSRVVSSSFSDYTEEEVRIIEAYHDTLVKTDSRWLRVTKFSDQVRAAIEDFLADFRDRDVDQVLLFFHAAAERDERVTIPKVKSLVRLLRENQGNEELYLDTNDDIDDEKIPF